MEEVHAVMDYLKIVGDAIIAFLKNFSINAIAEAYGKIDFNGIKDALIAIFGAIGKVIG